MAHNTDPKTMAGSVRPWHEDPTKDPATQGSLAVVADTYDLTVFAGETVNPDELWICDGKGTNPDVLVVCKRSILDEDNAGWDPEKLHRVVKYLNAVLEQVAGPNNEKIRLAEYKKYRQNNHGDLEYAVIEQICILRPDWKHPWYDAPSDQRKPKMNIWYEFPGFIWLGLGKSRHFAIGEDLPGQWNGNLDGTDGVKVEGGSSDENFSFKVPVSRLRDPRYIAEGIVKEVEAWGY